MSAQEVKLFDKYPFDDITVSDMALTDYLAVKRDDACYLPHSGGRWQKKRFKKAKCPLIERLACALLKKGRNSGKKVKAVRIVRHTCAIIHLLTGENPIQVLVDAVINAGPREDSCRVGSAGVVRRQAVDISPLRRVNQALWLLTTGARESAFRNIKSLLSVLLRSSRTLPRVHPTPTPSRRRTSSSVWPRPTDKHWVLLNSTLLQLTAGCIGIKLDH